MFPYWIVFDWSYATFKVLSFVLTAELRYFLAVPDLPSLRNQVMSPARSLQADMMEQ